MITAHWWNEKAGLYPIVPRRDEPTVDLDPWLLASTRREMTALYHGFNEVQQCEAVTLNGRYGCPNVATLDGLCGRCTMTRRALISRG